MADAAPSKEPIAPRARRWLWPGGLSARLLMLTILFVAAANLIIIPFLLASYEEQWLLDRVRAAELASLVREAAPQGVSPSLAGQLLDGAGVKSVAIQSEGSRRLILAARMTKPPYLVDLRSEGGMSLVWAPIQALTGRGDQMVRVQATPRLLSPRTVEFVEIVLPDGTLREELFRYLWRLIALTAFTSAMAGGLVYVSLNFFLVRPMQRITRSMERFRANPEDAEATVALSGRRDEVGRAEAELDRMQADLRAALNARARLAQLGEAVAKINHDLRNMLTSAQIASERLAAIGDPKVAQAMPRLERALDRAITLTTQVLTYGKTEEPAPDLKPTPLAPALETAAEDAGLTPEGVRMETTVAPSAQVLADGEQLQRILVNLLRNAREAIAEAPERAGRGKVAVSLEQAEGMSLIRIIDDGPGLPVRAQAGLFQPFVGSTRTGGTGLGLAIARELAQGHGGDLTLVQTGPGGSVFELRLPGVPAPLANDRPNRRAPA